ncbi:MAG TPA: hypothetical protein VK577_03710 [Bradyrhizobium sp.]|nr:hypothetical protein [Bradyrhizobium sp.]
MATTEQEERPSPQQRVQAREDLTRLINTHLLEGLHAYDWEGETFEIKLEPLDVARFIKEHWTLISRYAHLIHGS